MSTPKRCLACYSQDILTLSVTPHKEKVIAFNSKKKSENDSRSASSIYNSINKLIWLSRCNSFELAFTITLNSKFNDLHQAQKVIGEKIKKITAHLRYLKNRDKCPSLKYLFIVSFEANDNNSFHIHGMLSGFDPQLLTATIKPNVCSYSWFEKHLGYCHIDEMVNQENWTTYLRNNILNSSLYYNSNSHIIYSSRNLQRPIKVFLPYISDSQIADFRKMCDDLYAHCPKGMAGIHRFGETLIFKNEDIISYIKYTLVLK